MDINFTEEQKTIQEIAHDFAKKSVASRAEDIDKNHEFPQDLFDNMVELGLTGIGIPEEYGGVGMGVVEKNLAIEEIAKEDASTAAILAVHSILGECIYRFGNEDQKKKYLPELTSGGAIGAFALTEAQAGSDAGAVKTKAILDEDTNEYIINGNKCFITNGKRAKYVALFCLTDPEKKSRGLSCILVEKGTKGFSYGKIEDKMGLNGSETAELVFQNCRVPKENLIGEENKGFKIALSLLDGARIGIAAQAVGIAEGALDLAIQYSKEREQFGKPISNLQGIQWYIAEMGTDIAAAKSLTYYAACLKDDGKNYTKEAAMAKLNASRMAREVTNTALQVHGGYGYMRDFPLERKYRDAKITEIYEGTSEIQKVVISRGLLK